MRNGFVNLSAFLYTVGGGQAAPEQFGYAQYSVHIFSFCVRNGSWLRVRLTGSVLAQEYERCKAEYEKEKEELDRLYELERQARKESLQYIENCCGDIYKLSFHFMEILAKYIPVEKDKPDEPSKQEKQQDAPKEQSEYFDAELLSLIHKVCVGEQFEDIATQDFYANMNLSSCKKELKIKAREKIRVCYLIFLMSERLPKQDRDKWKNIILKQLDIDENYYKSKYKEPVSDFPSDSNQKFAKEMDAIFR